MERLARKVVERSNNAVYFTENPVNTNDGSKYNLAFCNTDKVFRDWDTQEEAIMGLNDIIREGKICDNGGLSNIEIQLKKPMEREM